MIEAKVEQLPHIELKLFEPTREDARAYFRMMTKKGNPEHFASFGNMKRDLYPTVDKELEKFQKGDKKRWGIYLGRRLAGTINLREFDRVETEVEGESMPIGEIGYLIDKRFINQGLGKAALQELIRKEASSYAGFTAVVHPENVASQKVLLSAGFRQKRYPFGDSLLFEWSASGENILPDVAEV